MSLWLPGYFSYSDFIAGAQAEKAGLAGKERRREGRVTPSTKAPLWAEEWLGYNGKQNP